MLIILKRLLVHLIDRRGHSHHVGVRPPIKLVILRLVPGHVRRSLKLHLSLEAGVAHLVDNVTSVHRQHLHQHALELVLVHLLKILHVRHKLLIHLLWPVSLVRVRTPVVRPPVLVPLLIGLLVLLLSCRRFWIRGELGLGLVDLFIFLSLSILHT